MRQVSWHKVRDRFLSEPQLVQIIDKLSPETELPLFEIEYQFGDVIFHQGVFFVPDKDGKLISLRDAIALDRRYQKLSYQAMPLAFISNGSVDCYSDSSRGPHTVAYYKKGLDLGVCEYFYPASPLSVSIGPRSLYILPKISEKNAHHRIIKEFNIKLPAPQNASKEYAVFREIIRSKFFQQKWRCNAIFFTEEWYKKIKEDTAWRELDSYLMKKAWKHLEHLKSKIYFNPIWANFLLYLEKREIKVNAYLVETLKYLIFVAMGVLPALGPAIDNEELPVEGLMKAYLDVYDLKKYVPSFISPRYFNDVAENKYVYHSLVFPTFLETVPKSRKIYSVRNELSRLISLTDNFFSLSLNKKLSWLEIPGLADIQFDYFHSESDVNLGIESSSEIPLEDTQFLYLPKGYKQREFCERSTFARGCIRISRKF